MALSDQLSALSDHLGTLAGRAKDAEDRARAAQSEARAKLETDVESAQDSLRTKADELRQSGKGSQAKVAQWWSGVAKSWDDQMAAIRRDIESARAERKLRSAQHAADRAEEDAAFSIRYANWAIDQAEYAVLEATLARMDADSLAAGPSS